MSYYEVLVADSQYKSDAPLTYSSEVDLAIGQVVTIPLRQRMVTGFVLKSVPKPKFKTKPIKSMLGKQPIPVHCLDLAKWLSQYYACSLGDALRQFAPSSPSLKDRSLVVENIPLSTETSAVKSLELTGAQKKAITAINSGSSTTYLLHGDTGSGKTEVYLRLAAKTLKAGQSVILLTPEIALTSQLTHSVEKNLQQQPIVIHSHLTVAERKKIWLKILESTEPLVVLGPRSALFVPLHNIGLVVIDEAHEPAYKQDKTPRYHASRVASQLGRLSGAIVIMGTATPDLVDYYLAEQKSAIVRMSGLAVSNKTEHQIETEIVDIKDRANFGASPFLSEQMINGIKATLNQKRQVLLYLNRRGTARMIICQNCGWQMLCPRCNLSMVYHGDTHQAICHSCGLQKSPPVVCPYCSGHDLIYKSIGTKAVHDTVSRLFPDCRLMRFDSDNTKEERIEKQYQKLLSGEIDIIIGTQLLAKGFDLPKLGMVGVVIADTSLFLPDYRSDERTYQLLSQVLGRVGRGHGHGRVVIQAYHPNSPAIVDAINHNFNDFYQKTLAERRQFDYPPFVFTLKIIVKRSSAVSAQKAAQRLLSTLKYPPKVLISGPAPAFHEKSYGKFQWHIIIKSKNRSILVDIAHQIPSGFSFDLDPTNLL